MELEKSEKLKLCLIHEVFGNPKGKELLDLWEKESTLGFIPDTHEMYFKLGKKEFLRQAREYLNKKESDLDIEQPPEFNILE